MKLKPTENPSGLGGFEGLIERAAVWVERLSSTTRMRSASG